MSAEGRGAAVPRLALGPEEAALAVGVSRRHFERHVAPGLPVVYSGARKLYRVADLEAWLEANSR